MVIHEDTIHFNDRPWSVCGYVYDGGIRYSFLVPEDLIFSKTKAATLAPSGMITWVKQEKVKIENYCTNHAAKRQTAHRPLKDDDQIIIIDV
ncbi:hypothetical protein [Acetobacter senegalensis]|uniref:hypothetical protein n=1 Tax=Acetobacter senegalensis TaxID=446692 RepID=UPI002654407C|nr:hypothetical protein [Acetobacter senegalensis]MDN7350167.1 hypothetical protein [Acetobacter senegalensis]